MSVRIPVTPDETGLVQVLHGLATEDVEVYCETADGSRVGYLVAASISPDEVEVQTVPGSDVAAVVVVVRDETDVP